MRIWVEEDKYPMEKHFKIKERSRPFFMIHSLYVHLLNVLSSDAKNSFMSKCVCMCAWLCVKFWVGYQSGCIFISTKVKTIFYLPFSLPNVILFSYISTTIDFRKNNGRTSFLVQNKKESYDFCEMIKIFLELYVLEK